MIETRNLEVFYQKGRRAFRALGPVDLSIGESELVCVLGQSGCGKSTLLRALAGLVQVSARRRQRLKGEILFQGRQVERPSHRRNVVFQRPALLPWLTVRQNVELGFRIRGESVPAESVVSTLKLVGLLQDAESKPGSLSGGMAQRAEIARSLVATPPLLLMDEPFSALDPETREGLQHGLREIWRDRDLSIVFVTHDIDEAVFLGTRVLIMTPDGRIGREIRIPRGVRRESESDEFARLRGMVKDEMQLLRRFAEAGPESDSSTPELPSKEMQ